MFRNTCSGRCALSAPRSSAWTSLSLCAHIPALSFHTSYHVSRVCLSAPRSSAWTPPSRSAPIFCCKSFCTQMQHVTELSATCGQSPCRRAKAWCTAADGVSAASCQSPRPLSVFKGQSATSPGVLQPAMSMVPRRRASVPALFGHAGGDFRGCCANESGGAFFLRVSAGACFCRERRRRPRGLRRRGAELRGLQGPKLRHELPRFWNRFETELVLLQAATAQSQEARSGFEGLLGAMLRGSAAQPGQCVLSPSEWVSIGRPFALQQVRNRCWIRLGSPPPPCDAYHRHLTCSIM